MACVRIGQKKFSHIILPKPRQKPVQRPKAKPAAQGLSFTERHRLDELPAQIDRLTAEIAKLEQLLATPDLYDREPVKFAKATEMLAERMAAKTAAEDEWLDLAARAED